MSYVIKAVLSNPQHPEYGQVTVPFPIPSDQYDPTIEMLQAAELGFSVNRDCTVDEIDSQYSVLGVLKDTMVNVDQLDYLAKRLDSFCSGEDSQFEAMAHKLEIAHIKDFINLTFCCQQATVITDFSDLERIGKEHIVVLNGGGMPMEQYQAIDGRKEALQLIENSSGTVTPFGVVYDNGMELEQHYNGHQFPAYLYDRCLMMLEITPKRGLAEGKNPEYLYLPAAEHQIERTLLRVGITNLYDAQVQLDFDELPEKVADALELDHLSGDDIPALNQMCQAIAHLGDADMEKLNAVVLMTETSGAVSICQLAENLDQFDFIPEIRTPEEYGRHMIQEEGGQFNECGYVAYHGVMPLEELMQSDPTEQQYQGPQMGGPLC